MTQRAPTALIADDEPLLRKSLERMLAEAWPELQVVAEARNGREAIELFEAHKPDICFLDVHMPGLSGVEAARAIGRGAHLVFVTAFDKYALQAFEHGVLDYLVKPVEPKRLAEAVARLKDRMRERQPAQDMEALLEQLAERLGGKEAGKRLRWLHVSIGQALRLVAVEDVDFLRSDEKYTRVAWRADGKPVDGLVRTPLKELSAQLDPSRFVQVHRSVVVNLSAISHVKRDLNETALIHLKGREEVLPVSRTYLHLFQQM